MTCACCGAGVVGALICTDCVTAFRVELADVAGFLLDGWGRGGLLPSLGEDLEVTLARLDQLTPGAGPAGRDGSAARLPYKVHASEAWWVLHHRLAVWCQALGWVDCPMHHTTVLARWLLANLDRVRRHQSVGELVAQITHAVHQARHAIDRPNDQRVYLGPCDTASCTRDVYALPEERYTTCPGCALNYRVDRRRDWMLQRAQDHLGTAVEIAGFLRLAGAEVSSSAIRGYAYRKRLVPVGTNHRGHPRYRIRDVMELLPEMLNKREGSKDGRAGKASGAAGAGTGQRRSEHARAGGG